MAMSTIAGRALTQPGPAEDLSPEHTGQPLDLLFVNPPSPDGETWIRCQYRAGQRAPDGTVWPQVSLAQLAALFPDRRVSIVDANARRLGWREFGPQLWRERPRWYVTQIAGPTLQNDVQGLVLAKQAGAATVAFGPLATPVARELLRRFPALDYVLCGEPEVTLRELVDTVEGRWEERPRDIARLCAQIGDATWPRTLGAIRGLAWRHEGQVIVNPPRPLVPRLDDLPLPAHDLLPLGRYCAPVLQAPVAAVVTGRGCAAGCCFCLKHVSYGDTVRVRSPEHILGELLLLQKLGVRQVHMQADLFTVCREQVADLCRLIVAEDLTLAWSCSARVDSVDEELLQLMGQAGCRWITWAIESGDDMLLHRSGKGTHAAQAGRALAWARAAGIHNWGSFILGLPGETQETIQRTIDLAVRLDLERVTFDLAVPRPGTPFWQQVTAKGWLRPGARWEDGDVCGPTLVSYPRLPAAELELARERAYREWALRPGSLWGRLQDLRLLRSSGPALGAGRPAAITNTSSMMRNYPSLFASGS